MTGVEILNEYVVSTTPVWVIVVFILSATGTFVFGVGIQESISDVAQWICLVGVIICLLTMMFVGLIGFCTNAFNEFSHIEYKVTIDDSVSMNEFLDKYEILDQEGKIYTVKERE